MSQTILDALADVEKASQEQAAASQGLTQEVVGKMGEIDTAVNQAVQRTDQAIADVNAAIPTAVEDTLYKIIYLDPVAGDDNNDGKTGAGALKTIKAAVDKAPRFGKARIRALNDISIGVMVDVVDKYIDLDLGGYTLEQVTSAAGIIGCFRQMGESWVQVSGGKAKTALIDSNVPVPSTNTALFRRQDLHRTRVYWSSTPIELGDHSLISGGNSATGMHELGLGYSNITLRVGSTINKLIYLSGSTLSFSFSVGTKPSELSWADLIDGVVRAADNEPRNILSNVSI